MAGNVFGVSAMSGGRISSPTRKSREEQVLSQTKLETLQQTLPVLHLGLSQSEKKTIMSRIAQFNLPPPLPDPTYAGERFSVMITVTSTELSKLLHSTQPKSSNIYFIPTPLIKSCFSTFFSTSPSSFKIAQITPLKKKLDYIPLMRYNGIGTLRDNQRTRLCLI